MEREKKSKDSSTNLLFESYCSSTTKIAQCTKEELLTFHVPPHILEKRETFWTSLFHKYSNCVSDEVEEDLLNIKQKEYMQKPLSFIQYWIDTGNVPLINPNENADVDTSQSKEKSRSSLCRDGFAIDCDKRNGQNYFNCSSSYSSVNTAAYILSNTNITSKPDMVAIVESTRNFNTAEPRAFMQSKDQNISTNGMLRVDKGNIGINKNGNNRRDYTFKNFSSGKVKVARESVEMLHTPETKTKQVLMTRNVKVDIDNIKLNKEILTTEEFLGRRLRSRSGCAVSNNKKKNMSSKGSSEEEMFSINVHPAPLNETTKPYQRKKLYSERHSPIDIQPIMDSSGSRSISTSVLHPALHPVPSVKRKHSMAAKNKMKRRTIRKNWQSSSSESNVSRLSNEKKVRKRSQNIRVAKNRSNKNATVTSNDSPTREDGTEKNKLKKNNDPSMNKTKLNPVVRLVRLSENEIQKYKISQTVNTEDLKPVRISKTDVSKSSNKQSPKFDTIKKNMRNTSINKTHFIDYCDTPSDQSTVLIYRCDDSTKSSLTDNHSISSANSAQDALHFSTMDIDNAANSPVKMSSTFSEKSRKIFTIPKSSQNSSYNRKNTLEKENKIIRNGGKNLRDRLTTNLVFGYTSSSTTDSHSSRVSKPDEPGNKNSVHINLSSDDECGFVKLLKTTERRKGPQYRLNYNKRTILTEKKVSNKRQEDVGRKSILAKVLSSDSEEELSDISSNIKIKNNLSSRFDSKKETNTTKTRLGRDTGCNEPEEKTSRSRDSENYREWRRKTLGRHCSKKRKSLSFQTRIWSDSESIPTSEYSL